MQSLMDFILNAALLTIAALTAVALVKMYGDIVNILNTQSRLLSYMSKLMVKLDDRQTAILSKIKDLKGGENNDQL